MAEPQMLRQVTLPREALGTLCALERLLVRMGALDVVVEAARLRERLVAPLAFQQLPAVRQRAHVPFQLACDEEAPIALGARERLHAVVVLLDVVAQRLYRPTT